MILDHAWPRGTDRGTTCGTADSTQWSRTVTAKLASRLPGSAGPGVCLQESLPGRRPQRPDLLHLPGPWRLGLAVRGAIPRRDQSKALTVPNTWQRPGGPRCLAVVAWENSDEEPGACAGSRASTWCHRRLAGVVGLRLGFGGFRVGCQAKTVAVAVAYPLGDVREGLCGPGQQLSAQPDSAGCAGDLGRWVCRAGRDPVRCGPGCGLAGQAERHRRPAVAGAGRLRQPAGRAGRLRVRRLGAA